MSAADSSRAAELLTVALPYLKELLASAPPFGSCGIDFILHEGEITRIDVRASVQRKVRK